MRTAYPTSELGFFLRRTQAWFDANRHRLRRLVPTHVSFTSLSTTKSGRIRSRRVPTGSPNLSASSGHPPHRPRGSLTVEAEPPPTRQDPPPLRRPVFDCSALAAMKLLHLATALLSTTALAVPLDRLQVSMVEKHEHSLNEAYTHHANFKTPFVVKAPSHRPPPSPAAKKPLRLSSPPAPGKTSWLDRWRTNSDRSDAGGSDGSCFCAGGSVCCSTSRGVSCNYGVCGI